MPTPARVQDPSLADDTPCGRRRCPEWV